LFEAHATTVFEIYGRDDEHGTSRIGSWMRSEMVTSVIATGAPAAPARLSQVIDFIILSEVARQQRDHGFQVVKFSSKRRPAD
jgi:hypothetical protein